MILLIKYFINSIFLSQGEIRRRKDSFARDRGGEEIVSDDSGQEISRHFGSGK